MRAPAASTAYRNIALKPRVIRPQVERTPSYDSRTQTRSFNLEIHPGVHSMSKRAADMIIDVAATGRGTVLTPGCNTPLEMYKMLPQRAKERGVDLAPLLMGKNGDFHMGMIDGTEWELEHSFSFPYYFASHFLRYLGDKGVYPPPCATTDMAEKKFLIEGYFSGIFKNVYVPWIPRNASLGEKVSHIYEFNVWLNERFPIDLIVCGIGPDGHIAFLGSGQELGIKLHAGRVGLWPGIRDWKWENPSKEACVCTQNGSCKIGNESPEYALTVSMGTIIGAKHVVLMAKGEGKAQAIRRLLKGSHDPQNFVAQYLRDAAGEVTILLDNEAASLL